jgi:hypothetical protein
MSRRTGIAVAGCCDVWFGAVLDIFPAEPSGLQLLHDGLRHVIGSVHRFDRSEHNQLFPRPDPLPELLLRHSDVLRVHDLRAVLERLVDDVQFLQPAEDHRDRTTVGVFVLLLPGPPECQGLLVSLVRRRGFDQVGIDMDDVLRVPRRSGAPARRRPDTNERLSG